MADINHLMALAGISGPSSDAASDSLRLGISQQNRADDQLLSLASLIMQGFLDNRNRNSSVFIPAPSGGFANGTVIGNNTVIGNSGG